MAINIMDANGMVSITYSPPKGQDFHLPRPTSPQSYIISGDDIINASWARDDSIKTESSIITKVDNLTAYRIRGLYWYYRIITAAFI